MICEVPGCNEQVRIVPGMGVVCGAGHAYHSMRTPQTKEAAETIRPPKEETEREIVRAAVTPVIPRMPFGKHAGESIEDLPTDYIAWCLENLDEMRGDLREQLEAQIELRAGRGVVRSGERRSVKSLGHASTRPRSKG